MVACDCRITTSPLANIRITFFVAILIAWRDSSLVACRTLVCNGGQTAKQTVRRQHALVNVINGAYLPN